MVRGQSDNLFSGIDREVRATHAPLAVRMRPRSLSELLGQDDILGEGTWLRHAIEADELSSIILFGPAGTGKTSLARVVAQATRAEFVEVSAVSGTVADLRREIDAAEQRLAMYSRRTILFVDEIHRFSRSQQDALLHAVEDRIVVLIGATTENPFFEVNSALISRSRVIELHALPDADIATLIGSALVDGRGLSGKYVLSRAALDAIVLMAGGDARAALTSLELAAQMAVKLDAVPSDEQDALGDIGAPGGFDPAMLLGVITQGSVTEANPHRQLSYDKKGDNHYDTVSAFIKSMRGSDADAAVYWLARMIDGGEDPRFIARRMMILASEDVGNADPAALPLAAAAFKSAEVIGYPECRINLAQCAIYLALAPKSNASYVAINRALAEVRTGPAREVPSCLRDRHRPGSDAYGPYRYPHAYPGAWVEQRYLPDGLERGAFWKPTERGWESYRHNAVAADRVVTSTDPAAPLAACLDGLPLQAVEDTGPPTTGTPSL